MNNYSVLPEWPAAYPETGARAILKQENSDFIVTELPLTLPSGEGEHVWLEVEKNGSNTAYVAAEIAELAGVRDMDVGFAGLKDRYAITTQWFSIYLPRVEAPDFSQLDNEEFKILKQTRHVKKLRRGDLVGNHFKILLRDFHGDKEKVEANLKAVVESGVPNYFGPQRFGREGDNVEQGRMMLNREIRVRNTKRKGLYLSSVRSFIFNEVMAERIRRGLWGQSLVGDINDDQGMPTGPLWGRGRLATTDDALALETAMVEPHQTLCDGLEHSGLSQERRALAAKPVGMKWEWLEESQLLLTFSLPAGYYATSLIRELMQTEEPSRDTPDDAITVE